MSLTFTFIPTFFPTLIVLSVEAICRWQYFLTKHEQELPFFYPFAIYSVTVLPGYINN